MVEVSEEKKNENEDRAFEIQALSSGSSDGEDVDDKDDDHLLTM